MGLCLLPVIGECYNTFPISYSNISTMKNLGKNLLTDPDRKYIIQTVAAVLMTYIQRPSLDCCNAVAKSLTRILFWRISVVRLWTKFTSLWTFHFLLNIFMIDQVFINYCQFLWTFLWTILKGFILAIMHRVLIVNSCTIPKVECVHYSSARDNHNSDTLACHS